FLRERNRKEAIRLSQRERKNARKRILPFPGISSCFLLFATAVCMCKNTPHDPAMKRREEASLSRSHGNGPGDVILSGKRLTRCSGVRNSNAPGLKGGLAGQIRVNMRRYVGDYFTLMQNEIFELIAESIGPGHTPGAVDGWRQRWGRTHRSPRKGCCQAP